jgi:hypothetical protein
LRNFSTDTGVISIRPRRPHVTSLDLTKSQQTSSALFLANFQLNFAYHNSIIGPDTRHVVVGAPSYFANRPRPIAPADLLEHECIRARHSSGALYRWEFERHGEAMRIDVRGSLTLDEPDMMAQSSSAGIGLVYVVGE